MPYCKRPTIFWSVPLLVLLGGCDAKPECDSFETRNAVLKTVSDDHSNALVKYAAQNANTAKPDVAGSEAEKARQQQPSYNLGEKIVTVSTSKDGRLLKCTGYMSVTVGDTKASKDVDFTVQQSSDGKTSVSVAPFQF
jgi:hypothetical protein